MTLPVIGRKHPEAAIKVRIKVKGFHHRGTETQRKIKTF